MSSRNRRSGPSRCSSRRSSSGISARWVEQRQAAGHGLVVEPARRAVRRVRAQARPGAGGHLGLGADRAEPVPGRGVGLEPAVALAGRSPRRRRRRGPAPRRSASQLRPAVVESASSVVPASIAAPQVLGRGDAAGRVAADPARCAITRRSQASSSSGRRATRPVVRQRRELEMRVGVDEARDDRHVAQVEVGSPLGRPGPASRSAAPAIVRQPSAIGWPSTGKTYRAGW